MRLVLRVGIIAAVPTSEVRSAEELEPDAEIERLLARIDELGARLAEVEAWANRAVASAQEKAYWLDRWHLDLGAILRRRSPERIRAVARRSRPVARGEHQFQRRH